MKGMLIPEIEREVECHADARRKSEKDLFAAILQMHALQEKAHAICEKDTIQGNRSH